MIVKSEVTEPDLEQMTLFYKNHFDIVDLVRCGDCKSYLAFELSAPRGDSLGLQPNEIGKYVVAIGEKLLSHRIRLDEAPTGERMVGYQCECGNDTRLASAEVGLVPTGNSLQHLSPFEKHQISEKVKSNSDYKPKFKKIGNRKYFDSFTVERIN